MSRRIRDKPSPESKKITPKTARSEPPAPNPLNGAAHFSFSDAAPSLSDSELRETAFEILVAACRSTGGKTLTFIPQSERNGEKGDPAVPAAPSASFQRSLTSTAASKVKKALGLKSASGKRRSGGESTDLERGKKAVTTGELMRVQMGVSEQTDSRIRRALLRIAAGQLGRKVETMVLPLELLQQLKSSDFSDQKEYIAWQKRNLKLLEAGLLLHPFVPLDKKDAAPQRLKQLIRGAVERPMETGKNNESMQAFRSVVMSLACRATGGSVSETCHWADGFPFNLRLYKTLLEACFDVNDESSVIEEVDEVLELVKKTWSVLGMNQTLHNLCFLWVLFNRFISTGQIENDLLFAANNLMLEVEKDAKATKDSNYSKVLSSVLSSILGWSEKKLVAYHDTFNSDNTESMESVVSLGFLAAKVMVEDISHEYHKRKVVDVASDRVDTYIRKSLRTAFSQIMEQVKHRKRSSQNQLPLLSILAQDVGTMAFSEKAIFSPILKRWHPHAAGVAVATLHSCYGNELKKFISGISELTPDAIQVLRAADKLEKDLVQIAVEDSVDSEDGGMSIIREMPPYEAETVIANLVKSWIKTRLDRLKEWIDRNLQQEVWNPRVNNERVGPSSIEVLRLVDETLEAFFLLPIPIHAVLLPELNAGLDKCLKYYIGKAKSGCGNRSTFLPAMPALTRSTTGSKFNGVFKKKSQPQVPQRRKTQVGTTTSSKAIEIPQLCCRINTLQLIRTQLEVLEKRTFSLLRKSESANGGDIPNGVGKMFELSAASSTEGIQQLSEATAYKVIFQDLNHVLWESLYIDDVSSSRIEHFLQELERCLEIISSTVHDRVRTRVVTDIMKASFDGFLLVLLAGGPSRAFTLLDYEIIAEDFKFLTELFWSNGDGLPDDIIEKFSSTVNGILPLFQSDTESLIEQFKRVTLESYGPSAKSRLPLPPTTGQWSSTDPNTLLRVLCYRCDETAAKFLKKNYNFPTKLQ